MQNDAKRLLLEIEFRFHAPLQEITEHLGHGREIEAIKTELRELRNQTRNRVKGSRTQRLRQSWGQLGRGNEQKENEASGSERSGYLKQEMAKRTMRAKGRGGRGRAMDSVADCDEISALRSMDPEGGWRRAHLFRPRSVPEPIRLRRQFACASRVGLSRQVSR